MPDPISPYQLRLMIAKAAAALPVAEARIHTLKQPRSLSGTYATEPRWNRTPAMDPFGERVEAASVRERPPLDAPCPPYAPGKEERQVVEEWERAWRKTRFYMPNIADEISPRATIKWSRRLIRNSRARSASRRVAAKSARLGRGSPEG